jgi:hypothetical protein
MAARPRSSQGIPAARNSEQTLDPRPPEVEVSKNEKVALEGVDASLARGLALKLWFDQRVARRGFADQFALAGAADRPYSSFGFFDHFPLDGGRVAVFGARHVFRFDQPGAMVAADFVTRHQREWLDQVREFALRYFLRVTAFGRPSPAFNADLPAPTSYLPGLSWALPDSQPRIGMRFSQRFFKRKDHDDILGFPGNETFATDLRELADEPCSLAWLLLRRQVLEPVSLAPPLWAPEIVAAWNVDDFVVTSPKFAVEEENLSAKGLIANYGFGYAFVPGLPVGMPLSASVGFANAFESIRFGVAPNGAITVTVDFAADRAERVSAVDLNPVKWGFDVANTLTRGLIRGALPSLKDVLPSLCIGTIDPVSAYIRGANAVTGGQAADMMGISRAHLDRRFLFLHFSRFHSLVNATLPVWRQIPNWLDSTALPGWIVTGGRGND